jgi:hypothetical protein
MPYSVRSLDSCSVVTLGNAWTPVGESGAAIEVGTDGNGLGQKLEVARSGYLHDTELLEMVVHKLRVKEAKVLLPQSLNQVNERHF